MYGFSNNNSGDGCTSDRTTSFVGTEHVSREKIGINERSTDTLVPDCDIEERSSKINNVGKNCDQSNTSSNISTDLSANIKLLSTPLSKDNVPTEESEEDNGHQKQNPSSTENGNNLIANTSNKHSCHHQNSLILPTTQASGQQQQTSCTIPMNVTCSSDDFSTEEEDGLGNGLDTACSSRHNTSSQNSTSQNVFAELETYSLYDSDGLLSHHNGVQRRLVSIFAAHKKQVNHLKRDLYLTRMALCRLKLAHHNHHNRPNQPNPSILTNGQNVDGHPVMANGGHHRTGNVNGLLMAGNGGGSQSGGCNSSVQSDASSWEAVDEKEAKPTLWVPDHAVSSCMRYKYICNY